MLQIIIHSLLHPLTKLIERAAFEEDLIARVDHPRAEYVLFFIVFEDGGRGTRPQPPSTVGSGPPFIITVRIGNGISMPSSANRECNRLMNS